jgi:hypothetical protein
MWFGPPDPRCEEIKQRIRHILEVSRLIDNRIRELEHYKARLITQLEWNPNARFILSQIEAEIAELKFKKSELERERYVLTLQLQRLRCL